MDIETIERDELRAKLDRGDAFRLVMTLDDWAFHAKRIPGSIHFPSIEDALEALDKHEEIVVYCSDPACVASQFAYRGLVERGYTNVRRYQGGLADWEAAGLPLEGTAAG